MKPPNTRPHRYSAAELTVIPKADLEMLREWIRDIAHNAHDIDVRMRYVEYQVSRADLEAMRAWLECTQN